MNKWLKLSVLDFCLDVCVLVAHVRDSCLQDVCVRNALCPSVGCFTMRCHCLGWLCARCLSYGCISGVSVLYVCVYYVCLQDIYPRCLCIGWPCGGCGCAASLCILKPKFEMSVCRMSVINACLGNDCVALISFCDGMFCPRCLCMGSPYAKWLSSVCVSPGFLRWVNVYWITVGRMSECWTPKFRMSACKMVC